MRRYQPISDQQKKITRTKAKMAEEGDEPNSAKVYGDSGRESYVKHIDRVVLLNFFIVFVSSFALGLVFLHSSLTFWGVQFYEDQTLQNSQQYVHFMPRDDVVSVVTYNANSSFSLAR